MRRDTAALLLGTPAAVACLVLSGCTGPSIEAPPSSTPPSVAAPPLTSALAVLSPHPALSVVGSDGATFNPATMEAFSSQGDGTLTIVKENSPTSFSVEQTVTTPRGAKTITLDPKTGHLFLITAEYGPAPEAASPAAPAGAAAPAGPPRRFRRGPLVPGSFSIIEVGK